MAEILHQLIGSLYHYLQGSIRPRWCRISAINSIIKPWSHVFPFFFFFGFLSQSTEKAEVSIQSASFAGRTRPRTNLKFVVYHLKEMGVSKNRGGPPKSSILIRFSITSYPFWGPTPIFGNTQITITKAFKFGKKIIGEVSMFDIFQGWTP